MCFYYFFPFAFTSVCTAELCTVRDNINKYGALDARVFGISVDSLYTLARYKAEENLNFTLLSDFIKRLQSLQSPKGNLRIWYNDVSKKAAFVINKEGVTICGSVKKCTGSA